MKIGMFLRKYIFVLAAMELVQVPMFAREYNTLKEYHDDIKKEGRRSVLGHCTKSLSW